MSELANATVYVRDMTCGTKFIDTHGDVWTKIREHGSHRDVWICVREKDGYESCFGGCAELIPEEMS